MNKDIAMENQHDFCKGRFCLTKLWWFCEVVSKHMDKGYSCSDLLGFPKMFPVFSFTEHSEMPWDKKEGPCTD